MQPMRPDLDEIAEYVVSMLDELIKLAKPLQDAKLTSLLSISADLARDYEAAREKRVDLKSRDKILPKRLKLDELAAKSKRTAHGGR